MSTNAIKITSLLALVMSPATAQYVLDTDYNPANFLDGFSFFTEPDPTHGFVEYVDAAAALTMGLVQQNSTEIYVGADFTEASPARGRKSVRLTSKKTFTHGLFIGDFAHVPSNVCGTWPAFWTLGPNWPTSGEIDILEGVNDQDSTTVSLHTSDGCAAWMVLPPNPLSTVTTNECGISSGGAKCTQKTSDWRNYGAGFNHNGGGVYAMEWTAEHIAVWFFPRDSIPDDITNGDPNPSLWNAPMVRFMGGSSCKLDDFNILR